MQTTRYHHLLIAVALAWGAADAATATPPSPPAAMDASARPVDISELPVAQAKAEVNSRLVAQASTLNGAHGRKINDDDVVCQRSPVAGSNIPGPPVCATKREWRVRAADTQAFVADFEQRNRAFGIGH